ncbi:hypothetical protein DQ04_07621000 [Trypanosoma grayi]|uniref:hypothetical protein n=1 Tax=Trypanosoma grayi TaxID=71804 RepID=UPI0004F4AD0E|nr:hypothetical protein DQ04_07621000 [Trypanosoma grayi]KEG08250.1 hypothetical protein DQ04_07621000 [Trypanosoma grayi]
MNYPTYTVVAILFALMILIVFALVLYLIIFCVSRCHRSVELRELQRRQQEHEEEEREHAQRMRLFHNARRESDSQSINGLDEEARAAAASEAVLSSSSTALRNGLPDGTASHGCGNQDGGRISNGSASVFVADSTLAAAAAMSPMTTPLTSTPGHPAVDTAKLFTGYV